jgi:Xaa-Pro dipeptidase
MRICGIEPSLGTGAPLFAGGPVTVVVSRAGDCATVLTERHQRALGRQPPGRVHTYVSSSSTALSQQTSGYLAALTKALHALPARGRMAIEPRYTPAHVLQVAKEFSTHTVSLEDVWEDVCSVKLESEIAAIRNSLQIVWVGQDQIRATAAPGRTELELFSAMRAAMEAAAKKPIALSTDLLGGRSRTARGAGRPTERILRPRDPLLVDIACRTAGYWADSSDAFVLGDDTSHWRRLHRAAYSAFTTVLEQLRPGQRASAIDAAARGAATRAGAKPYTHHTGHGIGTRQHEEPRLIPSNDRKLRAGMVITLEPGAYEPGVGGVRLECVALIRPDGAVVLGRCPMAHPCPPLRSGSCDRYE